MRHTPGPWEVKPYECRRRGQSYVHPAAVIGIGKDGVTQVWITTEVSGHNLQGSSMANALLIAAAPDYYALIREAVDHAITDDWLSRARAAIAKAEG